MTIWCLLTYACGVGRHQTRRIEKAQLEGLYLEEKLSSKKIAAALGWPDSTVKWWLRKYEIPMRSNSEASRLRVQTAEANAKRSATAKARGIRPPARTGEAFPMTEAQRQTARLNLAKARTKITAESRGKQSATRKAMKIVPWNKGKPLSAEHRAKLAAMRQDPAYREAQAARQRGPLAPNWKGGQTDAEKRRMQGWEWRETRKRVYERDTYTCQDCGCKCLGKRDVQQNPKRKIQAHHIIRRRDGGTDDMSNLVTLCMQCHMRREARYSDALFA